MNEYANPEDWRAQALCGDEDPELFFPIGSSGPALLQTEQAKAVCRRCTVTEACLNWALESSQDAGVWGGMSEDERRAVKRRGGLRVGAVTVDATIGRPDFDTADDMRPLGMSAADQLPPPESSVA